MITDGDSEREEQTGRGEEKLEDCENSSGVKGCLEVIGVLERELDGRCCR